MRVLRVSWRVLKALRNLLLVSVLLLSVALNVSIFLGGMLYSMASGAVEAVTGVKSVISRQTAEIAELSDNLGGERQVNRELRRETAELSDNLLTEKNVARKLKGEVAELSTDLNTEKRLTQKLKGDVAGLSDNLVNERQLTRKLSGDVSRLTASLATLQGQVDDVGRIPVTYRGKRVALSAAMATTTDSVTDRAQKSATRKVASLAGQALPWVGTAVIVGVTTMELKDLCESIKELNDFRAAVDPDLKPSEDEVTVCSMRVPTKEELWASTKSFPGAAWETAKNAVPSLDAMKEIDWAEYGSTVTTSFSSATSWTGGKIKGGVEWIGEGATGMATWTKDTFWWVVGGVSEGVSNGVDLLPGIGEAAAAPASN